MSEDRGERTHHQMVARILKGIRGGNATGTTAEMLRAIAECNEVPFPLPGGMERAHLRERAGYLEMSDSTALHLGEELEPVAELCSYRVLYDRGECCGNDPCSLPPKRDTVRAQSEPTFTYSRGPLHRFVIEQLRAEAGEKGNRPCTCHPDDSPPDPCVEKYALSECKAAASPLTEGAVIYQFREIGEGEGWQTCSRDNYDYFQRDPIFDTRTVPARSGQVLVDENELLRATLERARNVLENMAMEHETGWRSIFARWPIHHEPLRNDARRLLPVINAALKECGND